MHAHVTSYGCLVQAAIAHSDSTSTYTMPIVGQSSFVAAGPARVIMLNAGVR